MQSLASPELMVAAMAHAVGFQVKLAGDPKQQLIDYFHDKSMLLVMDNLEHLLEGTELLSEILNAAPNLRILATSRERLNLLEEWVLEVGGLSYPLSEDEAEIGSYSALMLFLQHARRIEVGFMLPPTQQPAAIRICRLVGGMPLGIELAAAWVRALSCEEIANQIADSLDILETRARNVDPRHRTMRAVFEPTWAHLLDDEQQVFVRLSVFGGGFSRVAAEQVAGASLRILTALVDKSLLRIDSNGRYDLHGLLRQYGKERLHSTSDMAVRTHDRHCNYYARFLEQSWPRLAGSQILQTIANIETELDNVRAAWDWAFERQKVAEIESSLDSLWFFYDERGRYQEGEQTFARAAAAFSDNSLNSITIRAKIQVRQGSLCHTQDLLDNGISLLRDCIATLRRVGAYADLALALRGLAVLLSDNNLAASEVVEYLEESRVIFTHFNDRWNLAHVFNRLSIFYHRELSRRGVTGTLERAEECAWQCMALYQQLESPWGVAAAYLNLADIAHLRSEYEKCKQYAHKSLAFFREFGSTWGILACLFLIGEADCKYGSYAESRWYTGQALQMLFQFHLPIINFFSLFHLALATQILLEEGNLEAAHQLLGLLYQQQQKAGANLKHHPAFSLLSYLQDDFPPHLAAAVERGRLADAETMVKAIIADFSLNTTNQLVSGLTTQKPLTDTLSERECEVLELIAQGCSNQDIANRLYIGVSTVKKHINHINDKLDAKNRTQAVAFARERQILMDKPVFTP